MAAAVDTTNSPIRFTGTPNSGATIVSASFTAPTDALLVVCVELDTADSGTPAATVTVSDSGGLTWTPQVERNGNETATGGYTGIFTARTTSATARTVTVARTYVSGSATNRVSAKVYVALGADVDGTPVDTVGANNEGGASTNNLTTTSITPGANGLMFAADCDWNQRGTMTSSDLTLDTADYAGAISVADGYKAVTLGVATGANFNAGGSAAAQHKWCQIIVREAAAGGTSILRQMMQHHL